MRRLDAILRRVVPAVPTLSRQRLLMAPLDLLDRVVSIPFGVGRELPPNRMRIRVGVGNRLLFNQMLHRAMPVSFWIHAFATGLARLDSRILDVGCGCGRYAATLRDLDFFGTRFTGRYTGIDIDREMVEWCRAHFPADRFTFLVSPAYSKVYNPAGDADGRPPYGVEDASQDLVLSNSLLTHVLKPQLDHHLAETSRVLAPGAAALMTVFCLDHLGDRLGGRWTFRHRIGDACVESRDYPEAAVAYTRETLCAACAAAGLESVELVPGEGQSLLSARKPP